MVTNDKINEALLKGCRPSVNAPEKNAVLKNKHNLQVNQFKSIFNAVFKARAFLMA